MELEQPGGSPAPARWVFARRTAPQLTRAIPDQHRLQRQRPGPGAPDGRHLTGGPKASSLAWQQLLRQAKAQAPVLVIGLSPVVGGDAYARLPWYELAALRRYERLPLRRPASKRKRALPAAAGGPCWAIRHWLRLIRRRWWCISMERAISGSLSGLRQWPALLRWAGLSAGGVHANSG